MSVLLKHNSYFRKDIEMKTFYPFNRAANYLFFLETWLLEPIYLK